MGDRVIQLDGRRRISLGSLAAHDYYLVAVAEDGVIILTPAEVVPLIGKQEERS